MVMLEFDSQKAILITYSGLGAAFAVLAFLIVFTLFFRQVEHLRNKSGAAGEAGGIDPVIDGNQAARMITTDGPIDDGPDGANGTSRAAIVDDWKSYGRLVAFMSRTSRRRGN